MPTSATAIPPAPPPAWPWRVAALAATLAAAAALAYVIALWGWRWFGPAPVARPPIAATDRPAVTLAEHPVFGRVVATPPAVAGAAAGAAGDPRLLGVFAGRDGDGYALFRLPDRGSVLARTGQTVAADLVLVAVRPDGVRLRERGTERDVQLRAGTLLAAPAATPAAAAPPVRSRAACAAPAGYQGPLYRINAELLGGLATRPESWRDLVAVENGALVVRDDSGVAAMLGLKRGDRLTTASGIALAAPDDLLGAIVRPLQASQSVRVSGIRDGKTLEWLLVNAAACAG